MKNQCFFSSQAPATRLKKTYKFFSPASNKSAAQLLSSDLKAGGTGESIKQSARVWCAIDTLLSGQFEYLGQAREETKKRLREAEVG